ETALAQASMGRVERREPANVHHKTTLAQLKREAPSFDWAIYLASVGAPRFDSLDVAAPGFFKALDKSLRDIPLASWKAYLRWQVLRQNAPLLSSAFVNESFSFFGKRLQGQKELQPRWKRCVTLVDA